MSCLIPGMEDAGCIFPPVQPERLAPIVSRRIVRAKEKGAKIIVADPRVIETARIADIYLQINNGCNVAFLNAFMNAIVTENLGGDKASYRRAYEWLRRVVVETTKDYTPNP